MRVFLVMCCCLFAFGCGANSESANIIDPPSDNFEDNDQKQQWRIAVVSDMNKSYGSKDYPKEFDRSIDYLTEQGAPKISLVLATGDMVAGQKKGLDYAGMWRAFHEHATNPLIKSNIPFFPSPGNHDASSGSSFKEEREQYRKTWDRQDLMNLYQAVGAKWVEGIEHNYPLNYAFTFGAGLFISLDATAVGPLSQSQMNWLAQVLEKEKNKPVKIIFGHVPLYPFAFKREREFLARGSSSFHEQFEGLLSSYNVNLVLSGHHHVYYQGHRKTNVDFISVPLLGNGPRKLITKDRKESRSPSGFLLIDFNTEGVEQVRAISSDNFKEIGLNTLPPAIQMPSSNSSDCSGCSSFSSRYFVPGSDRILFYRVDL